MSDMMERLVRAAVIAELRHVGWEDPLPEELYAEKAGLESAKAVVRAVLKELRASSLVLTHYAEAAKRTNDEGGTARGEFWEELEVAIDAILEDGSG